MASPETLDFDALLVPISDDAPAGVALRSGDVELNTLFYQIKDARDDARNAEKQSNLAELTRGSENPALPPPKPPNWQAVVGLAKEILSTKSKDLWIVTWLIEGFARTDGFAGLRDAFRLVRELSDRYWDGLHPRSDNGSEDLAQTFAQLSGLLDGALTNPIYAIPITGSCPPDEEDRTPRLSTLARRQAEKLEKLTDPKERRRKIDNGAVTKDDFNRAAEATSAESFRTLLADIEGCLDEFLRMASLLDEKCGPEMAPPTTKTREAITACRDVVKSVAKDKLVPSVAKDRLGSVGIEKPLTSSGSPPGPSDVPSHAGPVSSREEAFRQLMAVADFFRKTEPQSIVSYAVERVVRLGKMPLPDLLLELEKGKLRDAFFPRTPKAGARKPKETGGETEGETGEGEAEDPENRPENKLW